MLHVFFFPVISRNLNNYVSFFSPPGEGNEEIGTLIQNYIREVEELR